jgi:hypothetical protein
MQLKNSKIKCKIQGFNVVIFAVVMGYDV